jgi:hypothetical protein
MPELRTTTPGNAIPLFLRFRREQDYDRLRALLAADPEYSFVRIADPAWSRLGFREDWVEHAPTRRLYRMVQPQGRFRGLWEQVDLRHKGEDLPARLRGAGITYGDMVFILIFFAGIAIIPGEPVSLVLGTLGVLLLTAVMSPYLRHHYIECEPFRRGLARRLFDGAIITAGLLAFFFLVWGFGWPLDPLVALGMGGIAPLIVRGLREPPEEAHVKIYLPMDALQAQGRARFPCLDYWERIDPDLPFFDLPVYSKRREGATADEVRAGLDEALDAIEGGNPEALLIIRPNRSTMLAITGHQRLRFAACMRSDYAVYHNGMPRPRWWNVEVGSGDDDHQRTRQEIHALVAAFLDDPKALAKRRIWGHAKPL